MDAGYFSLFHTLSRDMYGEDWGQDPGLDFYHTKDKIPVMPSRYTELGSNGGGRGGSWS